jgi:anti-sigma regulatory factor (Ser/Thr protein kinase)
MSFIYNKFNCTSKLDFTIILQQIKLKLQQIDDPELRFKYEFTLEELLTNSFVYSLRQVENFYIEFYLNAEQQELDYREIGTPDFDFIKILSQGEHTLDNPSLEQVGGRGLILIKQLSSWLNYSYNLDTSTRCFKISFNVNAAK